MAKKKSSTKKSEKVLEIFEVEKKGKKKIVKKEASTEIEEGGSKKQLKSENEVLKIILITMGAIFVIFLVSYFLSNSLKTFEYQGMEFSKITKANIMFYHTAFPVYYGGKPATYNVYLRNDPRKLENIPFEGSAVLREMIAFNFTQDFVCEGDGGIAMQNFNQIVNVFGAKTLTDSEAICDSQARYVSIQVKEGEKNQIIQTGPACYDFIVEDCEILKVTERFLTETLSTYLSK